MEVGAQSHSKTICEKFKLEVSIIPSSQRSGNPIEKEIGILVESGSMGEIRVIWATESIKQDS